MTESDISKSEVSLSELKSNPANPKEINEDLIAGTAYVGALEFEFNWICPCGEANSTQLDIVGYAHYQRGVCESCKKEPEIMVARKDGMTVRFWMSFEENINTINSKKR